MYRKKTYDASIIAAAKANDLNAVRELLKINVHPDSRNHNFSGVRAIDYAIFHNNCEMAKWLIAEGASLRFHDWHYRLLDATVPDYLMLNGYTEMYRLLVKCGADFSSEKKSTKGAA